MLILPSIFCWARSWWAIIDLLSSFLIPSCGICAGKTIDNGSNMEVGIPPILMPKFASPLLFNRLVGEFSLLMLENPLECCCWAIVMCEFCMPVIGEEVLMRLSSGFMAKWEETALRFCCSWFKFKPGMLRLPKLRLAGKPAGNILTGFFMSGNMLRPALLTDECGSRTIGICCCCSFFTFANICSRDCVFEGTDAVQSAKQTPMFFSYPCVDFGIWSIEEICFYPRHFCTCFYYGLYCNTSLMC